MDHIHGTLGVAEAIKHVCSGSHEGRLSSLWFKKGLALQGGSQADLPVAPARMSASTAWANKGATKTLPERSSLATGATKPFDMLDRLNSQNALGLRAFFSAARRFKKTAVADLAADGGYR